MLYVVSSVGGYSQQKLGAYNEEDLTQLDQPTSQWYVPFPDSSMTLEELNLNLAKCTQYISYWRGKQIDAVKTLFPSKRRIAAINGIISNLTAKKAKYEELIAAAIAAQQAQQTPGDVEVTPGDSTTGKSSAGWLLVIAAAAGIYIYKKRQNKKQRNGTK